jgi:ketosteroid isomerase-like protein
MRLIIWSIIGMLLSLLVIESTLLQSPASTARDSSFQAFLPQFEEATSRFINGDARLWKEIASRREDATLMGGWGAYEKGWNDAGNWYERAAGRFKESGAKVKVEYLASAVSGDMAYTVAIERSEVRLADQYKTAPMALRVTHLFRREDGVWKLIHRHADPLTEKTAPATVLEKRKE